MPSNAIQTSGDGKVRCRMINDEVPVHICESEQGAYECEGCNVPTRRCTKCGKTRGIADAERGLCGFCAKEEGIAPRTAVFEGTPDKALETVLGRVRAVGKKPRLDATQSVSAATDSDSLDDDDSANGQPAAERICALLDKLPANGAEVIRLRYGLGQSVPLTLEDAGKRCGGISRQRVQQIEMDSFKALEALGVASVDIEELKNSADPLRTNAVRESRESALEMLPPKIVKDPAAIYPALTEHGQEDDGVWKVSAPIAILMRRFHLLRQEAVDVLSALAKKRFLRGDSPWDEVVLIKTEDVEQIRQKLDHPRAQSKDDAPQRRRRVARQNQVTAPSTLSRPMKPVCKPAPASVTAQSDLLASLPSMRPIATYGEIYTHLVSRSNEVRGERLVGGAVPMLQIRFKLSAVQSTEALEWLVSNNHLQQKDGWRTIALVSKEVVTDEGPARQQSQTSHAVRSGGHKPVMTGATVSHKAERTETVKPVSQGAPSAVSTTPSSDGADSLDGALAELERTLPVLRKKRDDLAVHVAQLEVAYQTLKALQNQLAQAQQLADSSLTEAVHAVQSLLSFLRK